MIKLKTRQAVINYRLNQLKLAIEQLKAYSKVTEQAKKPYLKKLEQTLIKWEKDNSLIPNNAYGAI